MLIVRDSFAEVYKHLLFEVNICPEYISSPRGQKIHEILNVQIEIRNPYEMLYINSRKSSEKNYIEKELRWYLSGKLDPSYISQYAKLWDSIRNSDGNVCSNYGNLIWYKLNNERMTQWEWAFNCLKNDKDSRQAILHFNGLDHQFGDNKDFVCTMYGIFHIRNDNLIFTICMRSSDIIFGIPNDFPIFNIFHQQMYLHLLNYYPELKMGSFNYFGNSVHLYEKHFKLVEEMLNNKFKSEFMPIINDNIVDINGFPLVDIFSYKLFPVNF